MVSATASEEDSTGMACHTIRLRQTDPAGILPVVEPLQLYLHLRREPLRSEASPLPGPAKHIRREGLRRSSSAHRVLLVSVAGLAPGMGRIGV